MTLGNDNGTDGRTDRRTDRQTDRQTDRVRRNMRPPPREEGRIIIYAWQNGEFIRRIIVMLKHFCLNKKKNKKFIAVTKNEP